MFASQSCRNSYEIFHKVKLQTNWKLNIDFINSNNFFLFFSAIMDCLVMPLQEKLEDWNKSLNNLYKEHAKGETNLQVKKQNIKKNVIN